MPGTEPDPGECTISFILHVHEFMKYVLSTYCMPSLEGSMFISQEFIGNSLAVQWLGLGTSTVATQGGSPVRELRSHKPHSTAKKKKVLMNLLSAKQRDGGRHSNS